MLIEQSISEFASRPPELANPAHASQPVSPQTVVCADEDRETCPPVGLPVPPLDEFHARWKAARARMQVRQSPRPPYVAGPRRPRFAVLVYITPPGPFPKNAPRQVYAVAIGPKRGKQAMTFVIRSVCARHRLTELEVVGPSRKAELVRARQECFWRLRTLGLSYPEIGRRMGDRDHTTILYGTRSHQQLIDRGMA